MVAIPLTCSVILADLASFILFDRLPSLNYDTFSGFPINMDSKCEFALITLISAKFSQLFDFYHKTKLIRIIVSKRFSSIS